MQHFPRGPLNTLHQIRDINRSPVGQSHVKGSHLQRSYQEKPLPYGHIHGFHWIPHLFRAGLPCKPLLLPLWVRYQSRLFRGIHIQSSWRAETRFPGVLRQKVNTQAQAHEIVAAIGAPNLKVQMDLYHCQIVEGDLAMKLRQYLPTDGTGQVGHIQIAGVPERHEPDQGELNYPYLLDLIDALGYTGFVGCEYRPRDPGPGGTTAGLGWLRRYRAVTRARRFGSSVRTASTTPRRLKTTWNSSPRLRQYFHTRLSRLGVSLAMG